MADNDDHDDNIIPFAPRYEITLEEDQMEANIRSGMSYFLDDYDHVVVVAYNDAENRLDVIENMGDPASLYELLQQAAANVALEAIESAFEDTRH